MTIDLDLYDREGVEASLLQTRLCPGCWKNVPLVWFPKVPGDPHRHRRARKCAVCDPSPKPYEEPEWMRERKAKTKPVSERERLRKKGLRKCPRCKEAHPLALFARRGTAYCPSCMKVYRAEAHDRRTQARVHYLGPDDVVQCLECGLYYMQLATHLKRHGLTKAEYKARHPGARLSSLNNILNSRAIAEDTNPGRFAAEYRKRTRRTRCRDCGRRLRVFYKVERKVDSLGALKQWRERRTRCPRCDQRKRQERIEAEVARGGRPHGMWLSEARVLAAMRRWAEEHGRAPTSTDWRRPGAYWPTAGAVIRHHGDFLAVVQKAGLAPVSLRRKWTDEEMLEAARRWAARNGRAPYVAEWERADDSRPSVKVAQRHFGSWVQFLRAAGLAPALRYWSRDDCIEALIAHRNKHDRWPKYEDWRPSSTEHPAADTVTHRWGGWKKALAAAEKEWKRR